MSLSPELFEYLQTHHPLVVLTVDESGCPCADMISWVVAADERTVRLAIGSQRPSVAHIRANGLAALQIIGPRLACEIQGTAQVIRERCESVRFPQTMVELRVESVRDNMYPANFVIGDVPVGWPHSTDGYHEQWNQAMAEEMRRA